MRFRQLVIVVMLALTVVLGAAGCSEDLERRRELNAQIEQITTGPIHE